MKHPFCLAFLLGSLSACTSDRFPSSSGSSAGSVPLREFPFEISSNKPWVQVRVDGSDPQWFILDTGCCGTSIVARACADRLHLELGDVTQTSAGAGEGVKIGFTTTPRVTLGVAGETLECPRLGVFPFDHVEPYEGRAIDGLLGEDFLRDNVVEIDYARRLVRLYEPSTFVYSGGGKLIPITFHDGLAVAEASMTPPGSAPIACRVVIDTGVRTTVIWYRPFVLAHDLVASQPHIVTGAIGGGAGGETRGDIGRIDDLKIGEITVPHPTVVFSRDTAGVFAGADEDGIVGGEVLRRCKVTFDYSRGRLYLEPYPGEFSSFDCDMSGLFLVSAGPDFKRVTIRSVAEGGPAAEAGLSKGDEILAIDGRSIAGSTLDELRELFKIDGATYRVDVRRGDERREVRLTLRRLV